MPGIDKNGTKIIFVGIDILKLRVLKLASSVLTYLKERKKLGIKVKLT